MNASKTSAFIAAAIVIAAPLSAAQADSQQEGGLYDQLRARHTAEYRQPAAQAPAHRGMGGPVRTSVEKERRGEATFQEQIWNLIQGK